MADALDHETPSGPNGHPMDQALHESTVSVLLPLALPGAYSYLVPADQTEPLNPGQIVQVPLGPRQLIGVVWPDDPAGAAPDRSKLRPITDVFPDHPLPGDLVRFIDWVADYTVSPPGSVLRMALRVPEAFGPPRAVDGYRLAGPPPERMTAARSRVIGLLAEGQTLTKGDIVRMASVSPSVVDGLAKADTLAVHCLPALEPFAAPDPNLSPPSLSAAQQAAADELVDQVIARSHTTVLLDGVTGAGKTEVYLEAVAAALKDGRQALVLLPEIALTAEFLARFENRFGEPAAEWHSALTRRQRERAWRGVASGDARVVIGARSALFLPFADLGLVVIDEEHEPAFKQEDGVIYHARDMGVVRGMLANAPVVLASATPSLESHVNAQAGKYRRIHLPERHGGAALPAIATIDLRREPPERGRWLSAPLVAALGETLEAGEQALLFLNRRGYAPLTLCRSCGHRFECPQCDAWLVEHRFRRELRCHHCGFVGPVPDVCPECGDTDSLVACGPGVERILEEAGVRFPEARLAILSSDHLRGMEDMRALMAAIKAKDVDLLIGTQLVAKGHHFPHLTLVGVVDADFGLAHGDPRAAERTYQLLHQVAGRAGRAGSPGRVFMQTHMPEHPVLGALVSGDRDAFYEREAALRAEASLPPFGRLVAILITAPVRAQADRAARDLALAIPQAEGVAVLGPAEAPIAVIRGRHRVRFLLKARRSAHVQAFVRRWLAAVKLPNAVRVSVDVDPQSFL